MNTSTMITEYLTDDEQVMLETRRHFAVLIAPAMPALIALLAASLWTFLGGPGVLGMVLWWLFAASLLWAAWKWAEWLVGWVIITNKRIFTVYGLIVRKVAMMPLAEVTDVGYTRSVLGRLLGYGAVRLESPGQVQDLEHINHLPDPEQFYRTLTQLVLR